MRWTKSDCRRRLTGASLAVMAMASLSGTAQAQTDDTAVLDEIVVTAQKRAENLQVVPLSVAAVSGESIEQKGIKTFADLAQTVPGVSFLDSGGQGQRPIIRGVSSFIGSSPTAVYLDDAPIQVRTQAEGNSDISLLDLARVEFLRGPQGTLYGGSAMGGAIKYVMAQPNLTEMEGRVRGEVSVTEDGGESYEAGAALSVPIVEDKLAVRGSVNHRHNGGWIDLYSRTLVPTKLREDINESDTTSARLALRWVPTEGVEITPSVFYQRTASDAPSTYNNLLGYGKQNTAVDETFRDRMVLASLKVTADLGDTTLTSISSYIDRDLTRIGDYSTLMVDSFGGPPLFLTDADGPFPIGGPEDQEVFTQEVRLQSNDMDAVVSWVAGFYYYRSNLSGDVALYAEGAFPGFPLFFAITDKNDTQVAGFGEVYFRPTEKLKITTGIRFSRHEMELNRLQGGLLFGGVLPPQMAEASETPVAPKLNVSYQIDPDKMVYAQVARGFRPGDAIVALPPQCGVPASTFLESDSLWTYEAGAKVTTLDRRLRVNGGAFFTKWDNKPESLSLDCGFGLEANVGTAELYGAELEAEFAVTDDFTLSASLGYTEAEYTEVVDLVPGPGPEPFYPGDPLPIVPKWTASVSGVYEFALGNVDGYARFDYIYRDKQAMDSIRFFATDKAYSDEFQVLNLRLGFEFDRWEASLFATNVFDTHPVVHSTSITPASGTQENVVSLRPRSVGVSVGMKF